MPKIIAFFLVILMSLSFAGEMVAAHKGSATAVAYVMEEESKQEEAEKKAKEDKVRYYLAHPFTTDNSYLKPSIPFTFPACLSAGYYTKPFNPPDVMS